MILEFHPVDAFVASSLIVVGQLTGQPPRAGAARVESWSAREPSLLIAIGLDGALCGQVIFEFNPRVVGTLVDAMGDAAHACDASEVLCEVANMIAGRALGLLEAAGCGTQIGTPAIIGHDQHLPSDGARPVVVIPLQNGHGEIGVCIFVEHTASAGAVNHA